MGSSRAAITILVVLTAGAAFASAETGQRDAIFSQFAFDKWRSEGNQPLAHSSIEIVPPELSAFQRIVAGIKVEPGGSELADHHALVLVEVEDGAGGVWQTHGSLEHAPAYVQNEFVLPGDYAISVALFDPVTFRHGFAQKKLHVPDLKTEPLPGSWTGLPRVEFLPTGVDLPDSWFLPSISSRLNLPVQTERPVHVDLLVNTTPSDRATDSVGELRRNMSAVIPALKVLSQIQLSNGTLDAALLDLIHRRTVRASGWDQMKPLLIETNPGIIDVHALDSRWKMRGFFLDQVARRIAGDSARVVIVLSGPAFLQDQEPVAKIDLPQDAEHRVFYVRCRLIPHSELFPRPRPRPGVRPRPPRPNLFRLPLDDLEQPLDASGAMLFDVITPEQFRRVLASIIGQISRL